MSEVVLSELLEGGSPIFSVGGGRMSPAKSERKTTHISPVSRGFGPFVGTKGQRS